MAMVDMDGSCQFSADSQPKSTGLVSGLAATRHSVYIHQMNRVNSRNDEMPPKLTIPLQDLIRAKYTVHWSPTENASVPIQLAQCWFSGLAISNAKI